MKPCQSNIILSGKLGVGTRVPFDFKNAISLRKLAKSEEIKRVVLKIGIMV